MMSTETEPATKKRRVMAGSIGDCVHSLGVETFAEWMEDRGEGYMALKLGPAVPIQDVINKIRRIHYQSGRTSAAATRQRDTVRVWWAAAGRQPGAGDDRLAGAGGQVRTTRGSQL
jgi:hypothetical protein